MLRKFNSIAAALIVCAGLAAYWGSFNSPFVLDDTTSITANPTIRHLWPITDILSTPKINVTVQSRPILNLSLAINYSLSQYNVWSYHVLNLSIHLLSALCLFGIIRRTLFNNQGALFIESVASSLALSIALLWVVHPLNTEAVSYIIQRAESLTALFLFISLYSSIRYFEDTLKSKRWLFAAFFSCLLGMATKEVMAVAPVLILLYDRCYCSSTFKNALLRHGRLYAGLSLTWIVLIFLVIQSGGNRGGSIGFGIGGSALSYLATQGEAIYRYLRLSYWPHPLVFEYGAFTVKDISELIYWILIIPLIVASFWAFFKKPKLGFLGAWFFIILSPTSLVPGTSQMIVEHRMYMPLVAVITLSVCGLYTYTKAFTWFSLERFLCGIFVITILLGSVTYQRNKSYTSPLNLWSETLKERPNNPLAHYMIAEEYLLKGDINNSGNHYALAVSLSPSFVVAHERFAELLVHLGNYVDAKKEFQNTLLLRPDFADANMNLGSLLAEEHKPQEAFTYVSKAVTLEPTNPEAHYNLANVLVMLGKRSEAYAEYNSAIHYKADYNQAYYNWANALMEEGNFKAAIIKYSQAIALNPTYYLAEYNQGNAYASLHLFQEAVSHYSNAIKLNPKFAFAELNLGSAYLELGELNQAEVHYTHALSLDPLLDEAKENLKRLNALRLRNVEK
ncbi:MAG: tetratricopeptide repeat protein [Verrucomicrobiota bacterium]|jgi:tetratricopeptide (TPR) repeat protein